jgi:tetratricopeptide (TPR) repeat protein
MAKIGRNAPCPCGSGKKYKTCCLTVVQTAKVNRLLEQRRAAGTTQAAGLKPHLPLAESLAVEDDPLDELSNRAVDLINEQRFDEAFTVCEQLVREYPDVVDGLERFALVHEARGQYALAADFYRRTLEFTERPEQADGFDEQGREYFRQKLAKMNRLAATTSDGDADLPGPQAASE